MKVNCRVEYECTPIRHIAIQCPQCKDWFYGHDLSTEGNLRYSYQINSYEYCCPICGCSFGGINNNDEFNIEEPGGADEIYKDCKKKKTSWE